MADEGSGPEEKEAADPEPQSLPEAKWKPGLFQSGRGSQTPPPLPLPLRPPEKTDVQVPRAPESVSSVTKSEWKEIVPGQMKKVRSSCCIRKRNFYKSFAKG